MFLMTLEKSSILAPAAYARHDICAGALRRVCLNIKAVGGMAFDLHQGSVTALLSTRPHCSRGGQEGAEVEVERLSVAECLSLLVVHLFDEELRLAEFVFDVFDVQGISWCLPPFSWSLSHQRLPSGK